MKCYDVVILGAGTAGLSARKEIASSTQNYLVVDPGPLGTTCARVGCMPSKVLIEVANSFARRLQFEQIGIHGSEKLHVNFSEVMIHVRKLRDRFVKAVLHDFESWQSTHFIQKRATFVDPHTLDLEGERIQAKKIIIATGSSPIIPEPWKKYSSYFIDTNQFFELESIPKEIGLIGLGVIGIELGQALSRLGVSVIGLDQKKSLGGLTDPLLIDYVIKTFNEEFPLYFDPVEIVGEGKEGLQIRSGNHQWEFKKIFLTMGRKPNLSGLNLENIGVEFDDRKIPLFDSSTYQIKNMPIYLVGDANAERAILHEAADEGRIAGYNSLRESSQCFVRRTALGIVFTDPNIGTIGKTYQKLKEEKAQFVIGEASYEGQGRAIVKLKEKGLVRLYAHEKSGKLLGAELFAPEGEHLAHLLAWVIALDLNVFEILTLPFYHPVLEEGLRTALRDVAKKIQREEMPLEVLRCQDPPAGTASVE